MSSTPKRVLEVLELARRNQKLNAFPQAVRRTARAPQFVAARKFFSNFSQQESKLVKQTGNSRNGEPPGVTDRTQPVLQRRPTKGFRTRNPRRFACLLKADGL